MPFDIKTEVTLECRSCRQYKNIPRPKNLPSEVRVIESLCPDCFGHDDGRKPLETWFSAPGVEVPQSPPGSAV